MIGRVSDRRLGSVIQRRVPCRPRTATDRHLRCTPSCERDLSVSVMFRESQPSYEVRIRALRCVARICHWIDHASGRHECLRLIEFVLDVFYQTADNNVYQAGDCNFAAVHYDDHEPSTGLFIDDGTFCLCRIRGSQAAVGSRGRIDLCGSKYVFPTSSIRSDQCHRCGRRLRVDWCRSGLENSNLMRNRSAPRASPRNGLATTDSGARIGS